MLVVASHGLKCEGPVPAVAAVDKSNALFVDWVWVASGASRGAAA